MPGQNAAEYHEQGKRAEPHTGQQQEVSGHSPRGAGRWLIHQFVHFIRRPIGAQTPGIHQILVEIEFVLNVVDAGADGPEQAALDQRLSLGRLFGSSGNAWQRGGL